jgi:hypothetical protein
LLKLNAADNAAVQMPLLLTLNDAAAQVLLLLTLNCCRGATAAQTKRASCSRAAAAAAPLSLKPRRR